MMEYINTCTVCDTQNELTPEDFQRGTYICQSCLTVNKIDSNNLQSVSKVKRKAIPLPKPVRYFISLLQFAIFALAIHGAFTLPDNSAYSLPFLASIIVYWLQKLKMGYNPFISNKEYEVNPKDAIRQSRYNYDPFVGTTELNRRRKAEKEAGRIFSQKEWDEYYIKYQKEHPQKEISEYFKRKKSNNNK